MIQAFIRKNTKELREKLEAMGYTYTPNGHGIWNIPMSELDYLVTGIKKELRRHGERFVYYMGTNGYWYNSWIDCGEDEEKFLTIAKEAIDNLM